MEKIAFVLLVNENVPHRIPATEIREEGNKLVVYNGQNPVAKFESYKVEHWSLELAPEQ